MSNILFIGASLLGLPACGGESHNWRNVYADAWGGGGCLLEMHLQCLSINYLAQRGNIELMLVHQSSTVTKKGSTHSLNTTS